MKTLPIILFVVILACCSTAIAKDASNSTEAKGKQALGQLDVKKSGELIEITFDDLKFEIAKGAKFERKMLGEKIEALNGKSVRISGYFNPVSIYMNKGIKNFIATRNKIDVNRGPNTRLPEAIRVQMDGDATATFTTKPITIEGKLEIGEWPVNYDCPMVIYHIKAKSVK